MMKRLSEWLSAHGRALLTQARDGNLISYIGDRLIVRFKIRPFYGIEGWLKIEEAAALYRLARRLPPDSTIVEIGSWKGKSTYCLARGLRKGQVVAIDPFNATGDDDSQSHYQKIKGQASLLTQFQEKMQQLGVSNKIQIKAGYSNQFIGQFPRIDLLFIDGDHSLAGAHFDFESYAPFISTGGYLLFHDYQNRENQEWGPNWVVQNCVLPCGDYKFIGQYASLWVGKKIR
jgi:precorrin-6B methylase 2